MVPVNSEILEFRDKQHYRLILGVGLLTALSL